MSYSSGYLVGGGRSALGDVPTEVGSAAVRTRYPSGPNAGQLADRYATYADVPLWLKPLAQQLGAAGYWYTPPGNPFDTWGDQYDTAAGIVATAANDTASSITDTAKSALTLVALGLAASLVVPALLRRR